MIRRPKPGESEDDILQMQEEFLKDKSLQPAAQVVNLRTTEQQTTKRAIPSTSGTRKPSKYAQSKGLAYFEKRARTEAASGSLLGEILEKNSEDLEEKPPEAEDDQVYYPKVIPSLLGNIVEKNCDDCADLEFKLPDKGFPAVLKRDPNVKSGKKSIFAQSLKKSNKAESEKMDSDQPLSLTNSVLSNNLTESTLNIPKQSYIVSNEEADKIHKENVKVLSEMSEGEILHEQKKLLSTLDPKLVNFLNKKRKREVDKEKPGTLIKTKDNEMEITETAPVVKHLEGSFSAEFDNLWENDILSHPQVNKWLHFENLEKDKLEWMKGVEESRKVKSGEPYEARFDFNGYLLPYTLEYTEKTKTLFHHGEEPHRPGYSLTELFELTRSTVTQQRVMALNILSGILEYNNTGIYKEIIDIPLTKIFFILRIAIDENKVILLEPALKAMKNLLVNSIDEACLDALLGFNEGTYQPCLENDKSEIEEIESKESELKDFHLAEIDLITATLRTDILQRLYYILETVKPTFNCVQYALQILTRLARDSIETAKLIVETEHLMNTILKNFVPARVINFLFDPNIVYSRPVLAALKLMRILSLQSREIGQILLSKYDLLSPISEYINSPVNGTYALRIQIEAFCILSNFVNYGLGTENAMSLNLIISMMLFRHMESTDIFITTSLISANHAAVLLQLINNLLKCNLFDTFVFEKRVYLFVKRVAQKWLMQTAYGESYTCGHLKLLCSALDCCKTILVKEKDPLDILNDTLKILAKSQGFKDIINNLLTSSNLLSNIDDKDLYFAKNLVSLGCSVIDSTLKVLPILKTDSSIPFLVSLFKLLNIINNRDTSKLYITQVSSYLNKFSKHTPALSNNWFTRMEVELAFSIIELAIRSDVSESLKDLIYSMASKLCYILRVDKKYELAYLFNHIIFNKDWFIAERLLNLVSLSESEGFEILTNLENIKVCYCQVVNIHPMGNNGNVILKQWKEPALPRDWIYSPILSLYSKSQEVKPEPTVAGGDAYKKTEGETTEKELMIKSSLQWILFNEICFPDLLNDIDITDRFCRIMCIFLCDNSLFLNNTIKILLKQCTQILFKRNRKFNFDKELTGLHNFQDFYTQFLEQFQSVSYGDYNFAACVLVPLAQRHNVKWRKLLWSEYAGCLRALDCPENYLCYNLNEYLYPEETDESLIKSYFRALSSNLLRPGTVAHKIALHHVECFKKRKDSEDKK